MEKEKNLNHNTKTKPKKKSRIGVVLVTSAILGVSIAGYGALQSESPVVWSNDTTTSVVQMYSGITILDEAVESYNNANGVDLLQRIDNIEEIIDLSEELHDLDLAEIVNGLEVPEVTDYNFSTEEVKKRIEELKDYQRRWINGTTLSKESEDYLRLAMDLYRDEQRVNYSIQGPCYNDIFQLGLRTIKAKVANACDFGPSSIDNMILTRNSKGDNIILYTGETGNEYTLHFEKHALDFLTSGNFVSSYAENLFTWQGLSLEPSTNYDGEKNEGLKDAINTTKTLIECECTITRDNELKLAGPVAFYKVKSLGVKGEEKENKIA